MPNSFTRSVKSAGFTIVELLITIVVIAVLAALTIIAFNGINARAENARLASEAKSWLTIMRSYKTLTGGLPVHGSGALAVCLTNKPLPAVGTLPANSCMSGVDSPGASLANYDSNFLNQFKEAGISGFPEGAMSDVVVGGSWGYWRSRSIIYSGGVVYYYLGGNQSCSGGFTKQYPVNSDNVTSCSGDI